MSKPRSHGHWLEKGYVAFYLALLAGGFSGGLYLLVLLRRWV